MKISVNYEQPGRVEAQRDFDCEGDGSAARKMLIEFCLKQKHYKMLKNARLASKIHESNFGTQINLFLQSRQLYLPCKYIFR